MSTKPRDRFYSNPGQRIAKKHEITIDDKGHKTLAYSGEETDIYAKILSHVDECDIEYLLQRCQVEGYEVLNRREAISGDVTLAPTSLMEAQQILQKQENEFNKLPLEVRKQFNFSFSEYIAEAGNDVNSWATKMGFKETINENTAKNQENNTEVKEEE